MKRNICAVVTASLMFTGIAGAEVIYSNDFEGNEIKGSGVTTASLKGVYTKDSCLTAKAANGIFEINPGLKKPDLKSVKVTINGALHTGPLPGNFLGLGFRSKGAGGFANGAGEATSVRIFGNSHLSVFDSPVTEAIDVSQLEWSKTGKAKLLNTGTGMFSDVVKSDENFTIEMTYDVKSNKTTVVFTDRQNAITTVAWKNKNPVPLDSVMVQFNAFDATVNDIKIETE